MQLLATDCEFRGTTGALPGVSYKGVEAVKAAIAPLVSPQSPVSVTATGYYATADSVTVTWTSVDASAQQNKTMTGIDLFLIQDGKIVLKDAYRKVYG